MSRSRGRTRLRNRGRAPRPRRRRWPGVKVNLRSRRLWLLMLVLALGAFLWLFPVVEMAQVVWESLVRTFGLGLALLLLGAGALFWMARRGTLLRSLRRWNLWIGAGLLGLALFGALSLLPQTVSLGGVSLGRDGAGGRLGVLVSGGAELLGLLRVLLLGAIGLAALAPQRAFTLSRGLVGSLPRLAKRLGGRLRPRRVPEPPLWPEAPRAEPRPWPQAPLPAEVAAPADEEALLSRADSSPAEEEEALATEAEEAMPVEARPMASASDGWLLPPLEILDSPAEVELSPADNERRARLIEATLANFGVDVRVIQINQGPVVTQFGVEPGWDVKVRQVKERDANGRIKLDRDGKPKAIREEVSRTRVKVSRITSLANDLALALAAPSIRIEAPVPGKPMVGIEVPNTTTALVTLRSVIETTAFQRVRARSKLALALGKGAGGETVAGDLARMPHLLIAGATGSGKSVCINSIISCLLMHATPQEVRFLIIDPKRVELVNFNDIPHLITPVVTDIEKVVGVLRWVSQEMERRYRRLAEVSVRNIEAYNRSPRVKEPLPYLILIIDELADLMMIAPYEAERTICRLAQLARATGIHLIIATQRPSVDVVTGLIKANFPTRIAFAVTSHVDSRTILDSSGAEKLLGRGDMLYMPTDAAKPKRLQGTFVSDQELERLVAFWKDARWAALRPAQATEEISETVARMEEGVEEDEDPYLERAQELAREHSRLSTSLLQRRLHVGYPRAARLMELLEERGVVGPGEGGKAREVLLDEADSEE